MTQARKLLGTVSAVALIAVSSTPAMAAGTGAGDEITNTVDVSYSVGGVVQEDESASDTFYVDRKIDVTVAATSPSSTVQANQEGVVRTFTVTNDSNASAGFALTVNSPAELENIIIFDDSIAGGGDNDGEYDVGEEITFIDTLAEDATQTVWVVFDVASGVANGTDVDLVLTADAHEPGTGATSEINATGGANTAGADPTDIQTVLADEAGETDAQYAGDHSAKHTLTVSSANVTVNKSSTVVSDPVVGTGSGGNLPKAIPGAIVEYCITVSNASGASTATDIVVTDDLAPLSGELEFAPNQYGATGDIVVDGDAACTGGTETDKSYTTSTEVISNALSDIAAGVTRSLRFRVTIR